MTSSIHKKQKLRWVINLKKGDITVFFSSDNRVNQPITFKMP